MVQSDLYHLDSKLRISRVLGEVNQLLVIALTIITCLNLNQLLQKDL